MTRLSDLEQATVSAPATDFSTTQSLGPPVAQRGISFGFYFCTKPWLGATEPRLPLTAEQRSLLLSLHKTVYCLCLVPRVSTDLQTAAFKHCAPHTRNILHSLLKYDSLKSLEHFQSRIITLGNFSCTCFKWHTCVCDGMLVCVFLSLTPQRVSPRSE